ncbi:hypothetical protein THC_1175 [Caldimicrobium thiodismutans]|jgi:putative PIN family toxin of toxin-antitoxin system|uniref:PIN domain-containing protein n=1 Tax=Caldimicrobium thiodismutans TaxID=1653476 RepID=A0A0U4W378_9BACT|nr:putative toxin-antitoxin system toxin component, PIN family [Caldimicrobium thiodismutans]BAU23546.1 hypothetical protein THC_1175 [Caldimicrobium thiodismutans]
MRVVFDTNVFVSAFLTEGLCAGLLIRARKGDFQLYVCPEILDEFERVLKQKVKAPLELIREAVDLILEVSKIINSVEVVRGICVDGDDDRILSCALSAKADYLVSGDRELLKMKRYKDIKIVSPREFESFFED